MDGRAGGAKRQLACRNRLRTRLVACQSVPLPDRTARKGEGHLARTSVPLATELSRVPACPVASHGVGGPRVPRGPGQGAPLPQIRPVPCGHCGPVWIFRAGVIRIVLHHDGGTHLVPGGVAVGPVHPAHVAAPPPHGAPGPSTAARDRVPASSRCAGYPGGSSRCQRPTGRCRTPSRRRPWPRTNDSRVQGDKRTRTHRAEKILPRCSGR
jgi:hypothetical protein